MDSTSSDLSGDSPALYVICCSTATFDKLSEDTVIESVIQYAKADRKQASLIGVYQGRRVFIILGYNNPENIGSCPILGFNVKSKRRVNPMTVPSEYVRTTVGRWMEENSKTGLSFPRRASILFGSPLALLTWLRCNEYRLSLFCQPEDMIHVRSSDVSHCVQGRTL